MGVVRLSKGWSHDEMSVGIAVSRHVSIVANTQAEGGGGRNVSGGKCDV